MTSVVLYFASSASAEGDKTAAAELLFEKGRDLLRAGHAKEACPKLAESQRLDPADGTLLALAMCHEAEGKLASAWSEFVDVETRSRKDNRVERERIAHERAEKVRRRLSTIEIRVEATNERLPDLKVLRDGVLLGRSAWGIPLPVDGGVHIVEVSARDRLPWKATVDVAPESVTKLILVPALKPEPAPRKQRSAGKQWGTLEWTGIGIAGAGVIALAMDGVFLASALSSKSAGNADCSGNECGPDGYAARSSAVSKGNTATALAVSGGVLLAAGATLFIYGRMRRRIEPARGVSEVTFGIAPAGVGATFSTRF